MRGAATDISRIARSSHVLPITGCRVPHRMGGSQHSPEVVQKQRASKAVSAETDPHLALARLVPALIQQREAVLAPGNSSAPALHQPCGVCISCTLPCDREVHSCVLAAFIQQQKAVWPQATPPQLHSSTTESAVSACGSIQHSSLFATQAHTSPDTVCRSKLELQGASHTWDQSPQASVALR